MTAAPNTGESGFEALLGIEYIADHPDAARARCAVRPELLQPHGLVHGGVIATLAESLCSRATTVAVRGAGMQAFGQTSEVSFLRPISSGHLNAEARTRHRGRTTWIWDVEISDDQGKVCALARLTIAVRPAPSS